MPKGDKWDLVKLAAEHWYDDQYFCNELFNGCNPFTIKVVTHDQVRDEFKLLKDENNNGIDLSTIPKGSLFLSSYPELTSFVYPNNKEECQDRELYVMQPEILTCIRTVGNEKIHEILGIGFYFGAKETDL